MSSRFSRTLIEPHPPYVCHKVVPLPPVFGECCPPRLNAFVDIYFKSHHPDHFDFRFAANIYRIGTSCNYEGTIGWTDIRVEIHFHQNPTTKLWFLQLIPYKAANGHDIWPNPIIYALEIEEIWGVTLTITKWDAYWPPGNDAERCRCRIKP